MAGPTSWCGVTAPSTVAYYQNMGTRPFELRPGYVVPCGAVVGVTLREHQRIQMRRMGTHHLRYLALEEIQPSTPLPLSTDRWRRDTVYLIGGGPSAQSVDWEALQQRPRRVVVAINDSACHLPWADVLYSADFVWVQRRVHVVRAFAGAVVLGTPVRQLRKGLRPVGRDVCLVPRRGDYNSGLEALYWVASQGARRVVLVGYDLREPRHWHAGYAWPNRFRTAAHFASWVPQFAAAAHELWAQGVRVRNANPVSAIRCFPFCTIPRRSMA